ncbi:MAG: gtdA [Rhodospirillales bacterium]|nr:gtdA [Rhodospirillales bacterium]
MRPEGDTLARYSMNLLPLEQRRSSSASLLFIYSYDRCREALERARRREAWHPCHGLKMQYVDPTTGDYPMTIASFIQLLPAGFAGRAYR